MLAVIHGFESNGWRDAQATQTYVLRDAAGGQLKARERKQVLRAGNEERLPRLRGDVLAQAVGGQSGFLYYDGAMYSWYDARSYTPAPPEGRPRRLVRGRATLKSIFGTQPV